MDLGLDPLVRVAGPGQRHVALGRADAGHEQAARHLARAQALLRPLGRRAVHHLHQAALADAGPAGGLDRDDSQRQLHAAVALYQKLMGRRPLSWNCRSFPSVNTRDLLVREGGFLYHSDPCNDDLPYFLDHHGTDILVVPYSKTLNDSRYLIAPGYSNPRDFAEDCRSAIDYMLDEADETGGRMLTIGIHARWMGQPNRASGLREIADPELRACLESLASQIAASSGPPSFGTTEDDPLPEIIRSK